MKLRRLIPVVFLLAVPRLRADVKLPGLFTEHAVLQAGIEVPIWGWANPGGKVEVTIGPNHASTTANLNGKWIVKLPAMTASDRAVEIQIKSGESTRTIGDVLIGEVWLGSGQSNMQLPITRTENANQAIGAADVPTIRLFTVPRVPATKPSETVGGEWVVCSPKSVASFSAVLYYFGRDIHDRLKQPVGLINDSWGGTPIQSWMPREDFSGDDEIARQKTRIMQRYAGSDRPTTRPQAYVHLHPTKLYNGMIAPVIPYAIRGVLWYQGENNVHEGGVNDYADMMAAMVKTWRDRWGEGDWPFLFVQIAPYGKYPDPNMLPLMWEQQTKALKMVPNSGMAAISDIGNASDIHPKNKRDVGRRLALIALAKTYNLPDICYEAPMFKSASREDRKVRIRWSGASAGLTTRDGKPVDSFELARADAVFVPASATIDGTDVLVESDRVADPKFVRFAWKETASPNLMNKDGLPAVAFRTELK